MLSERLQQVANLVEKCSVAADIGTDHAYIPIWLIKNNICDYVIAADISKGSCQKATNNIELHNLSEKIEVRCGDGLTVADKHKDTIDCIIISGMGGLLTLSVLNSNMDVVCNAKQLILQPQKDMDKVRKFVIDNGFYICDEKFLKENNKFYTVINVKKGKSESYDEKDLMFGKFAVRQKSAEFKEYLYLEMNKLNNAIKSISQNIGKNNRYDELSKMLTLYEEVYKCM